MQVISNMERRRVALRSAILIHSELATDYTGQERSFATVHEVDDTEGQRPVIGAGRVLGAAEVDRALSMLNPARSLAFLPNTLLAASNAALVWWRPPTKARVWFSVRDEPRMQDKTAITPHPGLVFAATPSDWFVFAVKGSERPDLETPLFQAPYMNVWDTGRICTGNANVPKSLLPEATKEFEAAWFESQFTHSNIHQKGRLLKWRGGPNAFWLSMLEGRRRVFPEKVLVPLKGTLATLLSGLATSSTPGIRA